MQGLKYQEPVALVVVLRSPVQRTKDRGLDQDPVLFTAPQIPAGMTGFRWIPPEWDRNPPEWDQNPPE